MSTDVSLIFDRPIIRKIIKYIDQSNNISRRAFSFKM
jgi:hypothetical protein